MLPEDFLLPPSTPGTSASASNASVKLETHKCCQKEKLVEEGVVMERTITAILLLVATVWNITFEIHVVFLIYFSSISSSVNPTMYFM